MSSYYGVVFPEFWTGETGRSIQEHGGKDAQLTALYLMSCRYATMIGLYPLPVRDIRHETGIGQKGLVRAFTVLTRVGFADYDGRTEHVWVREMAKFRLGLQSKVLDAKDNRVLGIQRLYERLTENPFLEPFFDRYAKDLHLKKKRRSGRAAEHLQDVAPSKGLTSPLQASDQDQSTGTEIRYRDQVQGTDEGQDLPPLSRRPVQSLLKTPNSENADARPPKQIRGVATALRNRQGRAAPGPDERRRGMEGPDPRPLGPIGFHGPGPHDAQSGDGGGGAGAREAARPEAGAIPDEQPSDSSADGRAPEPTGVRSGAGSVDSQAADPHPHDGGADGAAAQSTEPHAGTGSSLADGTGEGDAAAGPGGPSVDQNPGRVAAETPGQAELRRTIERLRRGGKS